MKIALTGGSGFVGSYLNSFFAQRGYCTVNIDKDDFISNNNVLIDKLQGAQAVFNLAGAPIINRWTNEYKKILFSSRVTVTERVVSALADLPQKPSVFISTSAIGIYKNGGPHTEHNSQYDDGFLGSLAKAWESAAMKAQDIGIRTVIFRFAVVLGKNGGALAQMLPIFKSGIGGKIGTGKQPFSWVHIHDIARAYEFAISNIQVSGVYNLSSPQPVTNAIFTKELSQVLGKPAVFTVPTFVLKALYGESAILLTEGQSVLPQRLLQSGFKFEFTKLRDALKAVV